MIPSKKWLKVGESGGEVGVGGTGHQMASQYLQLCRAVPDHLRRSDAVMADALATSVKKMGENISLKLEIAIALGQASRNLWKTQNAIRQVLGEQQLVNAQDALHSANGLSLLSTGKDPRKDFAPREEKDKDKNKAFAWKSGMSKCRHCGGKHLHKDCTKKPADKDKADAQADKSH